VEINRKQVMGARDLWIRIHLSGQLIGYQGKGDGKANESQRCQVYPIMFEFKISNSQMVPLGI
jgi:hypothetical protein